MATFFDTSDADDLALLHSTVRTHAELDNVVDQVEWKLLDFYSQREGDGLGTNSDFFRYENGQSTDNDILVRLVGYDQTTPADSQADLKEQLRRTIGKAASWVLRNYSVDQGVQSIRQGPRSVTYGIDVPDWTQFPSGIQGMLKNYDARVALFGL